MYLTVNKLGLLEDRLEPESGKYGPTSNGELHIYYCMLTNIPTRSGRGYESKYLEIFLKSALLRLTKIARAGAICNF